MFLELFLFAKKMKLLTKGGIPCISYFQVFPWHFHFMRGHSLVELTEHDDSTADDIIVHSMLCRAIHNIYTAAFIVHNMYR